MNHGRSSAQVNGVPVSEPALSRYLADREAALVTDIAALESLVARRRAELETIRASKAVRQSDG